MIIGQGKQCCVAVSHIEKRKEILNMKIPIILACKTYSFPIRPFSSDRYRSFVVYILEYFQRSQHKIYGPFSMTRIEAQVSTKTDMITLFLSKNNME